MTRDATQFWAVTVSRNGETLVTIESNCLSGKPEFNNDDARVIRMAAEHLNAFIGSEEEPFIPCDHDYVWVQETVLNGTQYRCDICGHVKWEADASRGKTPDPIAAAVDAQLDPLRQQLVDAGRKLAKDGDA